MPADALPQPYPQPLPGTARVRREYRDPLGRPLTGSVTLTGRSSTQAGELTIPAVAVNVAISGGVLDVSLPAGVYDLAASLRTVDGARTTVTDEITVGAP